MRIIRAYSLITLLIQMNFAYNQHVEDINVTNILFQYVLVCGYDYLCNKTLFAEYPKPRKTYKQLYYANMCADCSCDQGCGVTGDCCPDLFLSQTFYPCKSVSVLSNSSEIKYRMLDYCPEKSDSVVKDKCESDVHDVELLTSLPVTIPKTLMSYRNKYCAKCHSDDNFIPWKLDFECKKFVDINFLSSYEELWKAAENNDCEVSYVIPMDNLTITECHEPPYYDQCNVTGLWRIFDPDINWMCNYDYNVNYRHFKNVFCYICNPTTLQTYEIDTCNVFDDLDQGVIDACATHPDTGITFPYKNVFCCLCNIDYHVINVTSGAEVSIYESKDQMEFSYQVNIHSFERDFFQEDINNLTQPPITPLNHIDDAPFINVSSNYLNNTIIRNGELINVTKVTIHYIAYTTAASFEKYLTKNQNCDRLESCIFSGRNNCCADLLFRYPFVCESIDELSSVNATRGNTFYYFTDKCWRQNVSNRLKSRCENLRHDDFLSYIPIVSSSGVHYRNWYCFICNEVNLENWDVTQYSAELYDLWNIEIKCPAYLNYVYYKALKDVIMAAKNSQCDILFIPKYDPPICHKNPHFVGTCPIPSQGDSNLKWACHYMKHPVFPRVGRYDNVFCAECHGELDTAIMMVCDEDTGRCRMDGGFSTPSVTPVTSTQTSPPIQTTRPPRPEVTFRSIFAFNSYEHSENPIDVKGQRCNPNLAVYDAWQDECRNKTCFPGKLLIKDSCIPLLHVTTNLGYIMFFRLESTHVISDIQVRPLLYTVHEQLSGIIERLIRVPYIELVALYSLINEPCDKLLRKDAISIKIYIRFFVENEVERLRTEQVLQKSKNSTFFFSVSNDSFQFQSYVDLDSIFLPSFSISQKDCLLDETNQDLNLTSHYYRQVYVSNLLLCDQVELEPEEFQFYQDKMKFRLTSSNTWLTHDKFDVLPNGKARICAEHYPSLLDIDKNNTYALGMITLVCTIISLCCLLATFFTYMLFPVLRTIPGQNNVALVFAVICSQLLLQFAVPQTGIPILCPFLGALAHFFWLAMFGCMCVCSFHMFRVFREIRVSPDRGPNKKIIIEYIAMSYGLPALITLLNIAVHLGLTNGADVGYGSGKCFISGRLSFILSFLTPLLLICLLNVIFFVVTLYKITMSPKIGSNKHDRNEVAIYFKLFTLTGILWLLQVIDSFFHLSIYSYIVAILNGLQGLFIFLSYICNKRVLNLYRKMFSTKDYGAGSTRVPQTVIQNDQYEVSRYWTDNTRRA